MNENHEWNTDPSGDPYAERGALSHRRSAGRYSNSNQRRVVQAPVPDFHPNGKSTSFPVDAWSLLDPLIRRWRWLAIGGAVLMAVGLMFSLFVWRTSYTCTAQLIRYEPPVATDAYKPRPLVIPTLVSMIQSPELLQRIGAQLRPPLSAEQLAKRLKVTPERNSDITTVAVSGNGLETVIELANLFCREAVRFTQTNQLMEAAEANDYATQQLAQINADLAALQQQLGISFHASLAASPLSGKFAERIEAAREELANRLAKYKEAHPLVREQQAKLDALVEQITGGAGTNKLSSTSAIAGAPTASTKPGVASTAESAGKPADYEVLRDQLRALDTSRSALVSRQRAIQLFMASPPGYFQVFMPATVEHALVHRNRLKTGLFTLFFGALGVLGAAMAILFLEFIDDRLKTGADVKRVTRLPVLARLSDLHRMSPNKRENWAFRTWTALQNRLSLSPNHGLVCGITSSRQSEGRSTWIRLLAQAASQRGFRVLTIAANPPVGAKNYRDSVSERAATEKPGRADSAALAPNVLSSPTQVSEKLMGPNPEPMVHIPLPGWVWDLERRKQWQAALSAWRKIDNIVILVELPPASVPEAVLLAENLPNLIWLSESGGSDAAETRMQLETLRHARCNLVGAVLNREPTPPLKKRFTRWLGVWAFLVATGLSRALGAESDADANAEAAPGKPAEVAFSVVTPAQRAAWQQRLTLGPGDLLNLGLFGESELTREEVPIGPDGRISYLEAQNVLVAGLTVDELRARLNEELARYRRAPQVILIPASYRSKKYFVLGKVVQKGVFTLDRPMTIIEAVARARGLETGLSDKNMVELADLSRSFLARQGKHMPVNFEKLFLEGDLSQNIPLEPDDYLYFPAGDLKEVYVLGEVRFPGALTFNPDATALGAIAVRGGFTERAWKKKVLVVRGSLNQPQAFIVDAADVLGARSPDFRLQPKDIVFVNHRPWIKAEELLDAAATAFIQSAVVTWTGLNVGPMIK